ncbi:MAG: hypothetical protein K6G30_09480, partial [Acetatifactor sp.]|nr:hypothetical protein [Acetatifactor sp.]
MQYNNIEELFHAASRDTCCNTSYPYRPQYFSEYHTDIDIMQEETELSLYFHIPFCKSLCRFCEYTRFLADDQSLRRHYVEILKKQVDTYLSTHRIKLLYGLDIGGGTPSALAADEFEKVLEIARDIMDHTCHVPDFEPSVEFNYQTLDEKKAELIGEYGFIRA